MLGSSNCHAIQQSNKSPPRANRNKWCEFHRNYNHTTKDCTILKDQIEHLIRQGLLDKNIARRRRSLSRDKDTRKKRRRSCSQGRQTLETSNEKEPGNQQPQDIRGMIDYIVRGFADGGETSLVRKRHLQAIMAVELTPPQPPKTPSQ